MSCACDPTFEATFGENDCNEDVCWVFHLLTVVLFSVVFFFITAIMVRSFFHGKRTLGVREVCGFLAWLFIVLRIVRYALILDKNLVRDPSRVTTIWLNLLYSAPIGVGISSYTFMVYMWIFTFHKIIARAQKGKITNDSEVRGAWFYLYVTVNVVFLMVYAGLFLFDSLVMDNYTISNVWIAIIILVQTICTFVYGRRISKSMAKFSTVNSQLGKIQWFTYISSAIFLMVAGVTAVFSVILIFAKAFWMFVFRQAVTRVLEAALVIVIIMATQPSLKHLFSKSKESQQYIRSSQTSHQGSEKEEMSAKSINDSSIE